MLGNGGPPSHDARSNYAPDVNSTLHYLDEYSIVANIGGLFAILRQSSKRKAYSQAFIWI